MYSFQWPEIKFKETVHLFYFTDSTSRGPAQNRAAPGRHRYRIETGTEQESEQLHLELAKNRDWHINRHTLTIQSLSFFGFKYI